MPRVRSSPSEARMSALSATKWTPKRRDVCPVETCIETGYHSHSMIGPMMSPRPSKAEQDLRSAVDMLIGITTAWRFGDARYEVEIAEDWLRENDFMRDVER